MSEINKDTLASVNGVAVVLGLTRRRINQLTEDGIMITDNGKYNLADAVQSYITFLKKGDKEAQDIDKRKLKAEAEIKEGKAKIVALQAKELEGQMHRSEDVADITEDLVYAVRSALISLPGRLSVDVANTDSAAECSEIIKKEVYSIMDELVDYEYDPAKYEDRVRERMKWEQKEREEERNDSDTDD